MRFEREVIVLFDRLQIRYYGLIIVLAILVAAAVAARLARRDGRDPDHVWGALTWAIIPGLIFARLWYVLFPPQVMVDAGYTTAFYFQNFFDLQNGAIAIWSGGLNIFGAVLGGLLGALIYFRRNGLYVPAWLDIGAVALPLGQAIGRWANYVNQELYGTITTLPWGIPIDSASRVFPFRSTVQYPVNTTLFHPLFLYESLWSLLAFVALLWLFQRRRASLRPGDIFLIYVLQYTFIRFLLEFLRLEITVLGGVNVNQAVSAALFVVAAVLLFARRRGPAPTPQPDRPMPQPTPRTPRTGAGKTA